MPSINSLDIPKKSIQLTLNGHIDNIKLLQKRIKAHSIHIAVGGGLKHLDQINLIPNAWIGDGDSCSEDLLLKYPNIAKEYHPKDKDNTDFFLAVSYAKKKFNFEKMTIFAGFSSRIDHCLSNLFTAANAKLPIFFETETHITFFCNKNIEIKTRPGQAISLMPLSPCTNVSTKGLKWELNHKNLNASFFSLSNEALSDEVYISKEEGLLAITLFVKKDIRQIQP
jgi:thiamine pyrophosphokinase